MGCSGRASEVAKGLGLIDSERRRAEEIVT